MEVTRYDYIELSTTATRTDEGYLKSRSILTRAGVFTYIDENGNIRKEYRPREEVFSQDSINSIKLKPITYDHPKGKVNIDNVKDLSIGFVGEEVLHDDTFLSSNILITNKDAITSVENRERNQISCGYGCILEFTPGIYEGERYDAIQRSIRYNHVAIVKKGRAGVDASIRLDSNEAYCIIENDTVCVKNKDKKDNVVKKLVIDNIEYEVDEAFIPLYNQMRKDNKDLVDKYSTIEAEKDDIKSKYDSLVNEVEVLKSDSVSKSEIGNIIKERVDLYDIAKNFLEKEEVEKLDDMETIEIKKLILSKKIENIHEKNDSYVNVRFDIFKEDNVDVEIDINRKKVIGNFKEDSAPKDKVIDARQRYIDSLKNAYKVEE